MNGQKLHEDHDYVLEFFEKLFKKQLFRSACRVTVIVTKLVPLPFSRIEGGYLDELLGEAAHGVLVVVQIHGEKKSQFPEHVWGSFWGNEIFSKLAQRFFEKTL